MKIKVSSESLDTLTHDSLAFGFFSDERPPRGYCGLADWRLNGLVSNLIADGRLTGAFMEKVLISSDQRIPSPKILLMGLGESNQLTYEKLYTVGGTILRTLSEAECTDFAFDIPGSDRCNLEAPKMAVALVSGIFESESLKQGGTVPDMVVLSGRDFFDEVVLGMHELKVSVRDKIEVDILAETAPVRNTQP
ncbi:MAG: M17 family peptidase N-terminal domain-containing protein [Syntrophales bacterium]|nr:M17 family peptidase N-terminal domain-containing protein [Syntrophales bacterium]